MNLFTKILTFLSVLAMLSVAQVGNAQMASWYGPGFHGKTTANGERYDMYALTAAHKTLPFGTKVEVTNLNNGKSAIVRINDRGPFIKGRIIDISKKANQLLNCDLCKVKIKILK